MFIAILFLTSIPQQWMDKQIVVYQYDEILFSNKGEWTINI